MKEVATSGLTNNYPYNSAIAPDQCRAHCILEVLDRGANPSPSCGRRLAPSQACGAEPRHTSDTPQRAAQCLLPKTSAAIAERISLTFRVNRSGEAEGQRGQRRLPATTLG